MLLCHGHVDPAIKECRGRIKTIKKNINGKKSSHSVLDRTGKPARTGIEVVAHVWLGETESETTLAEEGDCSTTGRASETGARICEPPRKRPFSLVKCRLYTGRTHQIRVHLASELGHPLFCDRKYSKEYNGDVRICREILAVDGGADGGAEGRTDGVPPNAGPRADLAWLQAAQFG